MDDDVYSKEYSLSRPLDISDDDILEAMRGIGGYVDITPADFREVYRLAFRYAIEHLMHSIVAKDIMTKQVIFVQTDTPLEKVAEDMARHSVSGIPVVGSDGKVIGVISEKNFLFHMGTSETASTMGIIDQCLRNEGCMIEPIVGQTARDIMTSPPITVGEDISLSGIIDIFTSRHINRVPVIDPNGKLSGIVSRADVLKSPLFLKNSTIRG